MNETRALLELLYSVSREVATALDLRTVLQRVLYAAIENVGGERGSVVVLDENGKPLDATIVYGRTFHDHTTRQLKETVERGLAGWVIRHRKAVLIPDTSQDQRWLQRPDDSLHKSRAKSAICVPLLAREQLVGVLTLVHSMPNAFAPGHLELMQAIADQAGVAILNARLYTESQRQARVMTALANGAVAINATLQLDEVFQRVLEQTIQALQVATVALAMFESGSGELVRLAASGKDAGRLVGQRLLPDLEVVKQVVSSRQALVLPSGEKETRAQEMEYLKSLQARLVIVAPVQSQGRVMGILEAINPPTNLFDTDALLAINGIGSLAGTTIQNALLFERLQQAHRQYQELFDDSIDSIFITNHKGHILDANRQATALSGYSREELRRMRIEQVHEVQWKNVGAHFKALASGATCGYESLLRRQDGTTVPVEVHARRIDFEETQVCQWILRDITARKMLDSLRNDLTAMIYHDLRSPLANVISSLELLSGMVGDDEEERALLNVASNSAMRIQRLLSSLLDIGRLESGQPILSQELVEPSRLVEEAMAVVEPAAAGRQQVIVPHLEADLPAVWVDADMMRRVLINLLENAVKFSPTAASIEVGGRRDGEEICLWVKDNGPGIPLAEQERIFDKYSRLDATGSTKTAGFGLGLAFCRLAVQGHGGRIWVESEPERGARFLFTLPLGTGKNESPSLA